MCVREMKFLRKKNSKGTLILQDLHSKDFHPESIGKSHEELMAQIHGVYADGEVITGVAVFREAYKRIGLGWLCSPTGWPVLKLFFDWAYRVFARNRIRIGRLLGRDESDLEDCEHCSNFKPES